MGKRLPIFQGRRFGCTQCGNCCRQPGWVFFSYEEMKAMARHLGQTLARFKTTYGVTWDPAAECWAVDALEGQGCPLLDEVQGCRVHPVKPTQCKTFPFWSELLDDRDAWEATKAYCPGMDAEDGRLYDREEIVAIRREQRGT